MYLKVAVTCPLAIYTSQMLLLNSFSCQEGEHPVSLEASANKVYLVAASWCPPLAAQGDFEYAQTKLARLQDALSWPRDYSDLLPSPPLTQSLLLYMAFSATLCIWRRLLDS